MFIVFVSVWTSRKGQNILDLNTDQHVHDLNSYVLCSNVLFYYIMQMLVAKLLSFIVLFNNIIVEI